MRKKQTSARRTTSTTGTTASRSHKITHTIFSSARVCCCGRCLEVIISTISSPSFSPSQSLYSSIHSSNSDLLLPGIPFSTTCTKVFPFWVVRKVLGTTSTSFFLDNNFNRGSHSWINGLITSSKRMLASKWNHSRLFYRVYRFL